MISIAKRILFFFFPFPAILFSLLGYSASLSILC